jgi:salicylate hydroxylase
MLPGRSDKHYLGISGLVLGIALDSRGIPVTIYEQAPTFAEIGAGVGFTANAIGAMQQCSPGIHDAFEKVRTRNVWESKKNVYFDFHDGMTDKEDTRAFTITDKIGMAGCHRAHFLDELIKMFPDNRVRFGKRLDRLYEDKTGRSVMRFVDGSTASADAVIGCDGIKSNVRRLLYGDKDPRSYPTYTYRYAYRALADMEEAIKAVGEEMALNSCMHVSHLPWPAVVLISDQRLTRIR